MGHTPPHEGYEVHLLCAYGLGVSGSQDAVVCRLNASELPWHRGTFTPATRFPWTTTSNSKQSVLTLLPTCKCMHYEVLDGGAVREMNIVDWLLLSLEAMTVCSSSQLMANPSKARDSGGGGVKRRKGTHA
jgi:hypothetical protein